MDISSSQKLRQAAIVLAALGESLAAEACSHLPPSQVLRLGEAVAELGWVTAEELQEALEAFHAWGNTSTRLGGNDFARSLVDATLGGNHGAEAYPQTAGGELAVFARLDDLPLALLTRLLGEESRQVLAVTVSHLSPVRAGQFLAQFDEATAADIAYRAAHLNPPAPGALEALAVALDLARRATHVQSEAAPEVSLQYVVELIGALPATKSKAVLEALRHLDAPFGESVAEQVFTFEDIISLSDNDLQVLLRNVDMNQLVVGLKGTAAELRDRVKANLSQRGRERLSEEMEMLGPVPLSQVQEAQRQLCAEARSLAERGEINLESGQEEYVE